MFDKMLGIRCFVLLVFYMWGERGVGTRGQLQSDCEDGAAASAGVLLSPRSSDEMRRHALYHGPWGACVRGARPHIASPLASHYLSRDLCAPSLLFHPNHSR